MSTEGKGVRKTLTLRKSGFARAELEEQAAREAVPVSRLVARAAQYLAADLHSQRPATKLPRFKEGRERGEGETVELTVHLDAEVWRAIDTYARQEDVLGERVLEHAALYYLADLHSGRLTQRLAATAAATSSPQ